MKMKQMIKRTRGITLVEILVGMAVSGIIIAGMIALFRQTVKTNQYIDNQISGQIQAQRMFTMINNDLRKVTASETGAYPIELATSTALTFYSDIDNDGRIERVHYFLQANGPKNELKKGILEPATAPPIYTGTEKVSVIANYIVNNTTTTPIFSYYDVNYTGIEDPITHAPPLPLAEPVSIIDIRLIKITLDIDDPNSPNQKPVQLTTQSSLRNLKDNL